MTRLLALACSLLVLPLTAHAGARVQYALIVSNNGSNDPSLQPLRYADDDGARYFELLSRQSAEAHLLAVLDEQTQARHPGLAAKTRAPTHAELLSTLGRLNARMEKDKEAGKEPVLFFVFTGHGQRKKAGEGTISLLGRDFTRAELYEEVLAKSQARFIHLIVDACDSYFFVNARGALPKAESYAGAVRQFLDERTLEQHPQVGVILSTASQKESHEWSGFQGGVFSHQVLSALGGAADVNQDGKVEYSEVRAFIAAANARVQDPRARPEVFARAPAQDGNVALVDFTQKSDLAYLSVPADVTGRFWLEDGRGVRWTDFHKEPNRRLVLAVPPERALFLRSAERELSFTPSRSGQVIDVAHLTWRDGAVASRGSLEETFRDDLFSVAFGANFYSGFVASTGEVPVAPAVGPDLSE